MSMFFFRHRNLKRDEENKKREKQKIEQTYHFTRQRRGAKVFKTSSPSSESDQLTAPSRLFERTSINPRDSMDAVALQIPRCVRLFCLFFILLCVIGTATTSNSHTYWRWEMRCDIIPLSVTMSIVLLLRCCAVITLTFPYTPSRDARELKSYKNLISCEWWINAKNEKELCFALFWRYVYFLLMLRKHKSVTRNVVIVVVALASGRKIENSIVVSYWKFPRYWLLGAEN